MAACRRGFQRQWGGRGSLRQDPGKNKASPLHLAGEASPLAAPFRAAVAKSP
jgi:hypothetical protein